MDSYLKIIEQIGEGAFSKLYSAYDSHLNKYVALKIEKNNNKKTLLKKEFQIYNSLKVYLVFQKYIIIFQILQMKKMK